MGGFLLLLPLLLQGIKGVPTIPENFSIYDYQPLFDQVDEEVDAVFAGVGDADYVRGIIFSYYLGDGSTPAEIFETFTPPHIPTVEKYFLKWKLDKENSHLFLTKYQISPTYETLEQLLATNYFAVKLFTKMKKVEEVLVKDSKEFLQTLKRGRVDYKPSSTFKMIMEVQTISESPAYYVLRDAEGGLDTENLSTEEILRGQGIKPSSSISFTVIGIRDYDIEDKNMSSDFDSWGYFGVQPQQILFYPRKAENLSEEVLTKLRFKSARFSPLYNLLYTRLDGNNSEHDSLLSGVMQKIYTTIGYKFLKPLGKLASCLKEEVDTGMFQVDYTPGARGNLAYRTWNSVKYIIKRLYSYTTKGTDVSDIVQKGVSYADIRINCSDKYNVEDPEFLEKWKPVLTFAKINLAGAHCDGTSDVAEYTSSLNHFVSPFRTLVEELEDTYRWYALLHKITCLATPPSYQRRMRRKYLSDVIAGNYYLNNNESGGTGITFKDAVSQNLYNFLKKVFQVDVTGYHGECCGEKPDCLEHSPYCGTGYEANRKKTVNNLNMTEQKIGELKSILERVVSDTRTYHCDDGEVNQVTITGNIISVSDIIKEAGSSCISSTKHGFQKLLIFAENGIYIDANIIGGMQQFKNAQIFFIAPYIYRNNNGRMDYYCTTDYHWRPEWTKYWGFMHKTFTNNEFTMAGSIVAARCGNNNINAKTGLAKSINQFILYARQSTKILDYMNFNLEKFMGSIIRNDTEMLGVRCQTGGLTDEEGLLRTHDFYRVDSTPEERQRYIEEFKELGRICKEKYNSSYNVGGGMTEKKWGEEEVGTTPRISETGFKEPSTPSIVLEPSWILVILGGMGGASLILFSIIIGVMIRYCCFVNVRRNTIILKPDNPNHSL